MKNNFAFYLTKYMKIYLPGLQNVRPNTIVSYRDAFIVLFRFCKEKRNIPTEKLDFKHLSRELIEEFLLWLKDKGCADSTLNHRLSAVRAFFRYILIEAPEHLMLCQSIINMKSPKLGKPVIKYLDKEGITTLLNSPDVTTRDGRRDLAILQMLYDTGARVSELCDLKVRDLRLKSSPVVKLLGKLNKERYVPLSSQTAKLMSEYLSEYKLNEPQYLDYPLFTNHLGRKLSRSGIRYILSKYIEANNDVLPDNITPHCLRHSKATHLVESGVNIIYVRDLLGHENIKTTERYVKTNPEVKRVALTKTFNEPLIPERPSWLDDPDVMKMLKSIGE